MRLWMLILTIKFHSFRETFDEVLKETCEMDLQKMIAELKKERDGLLIAIEALERLAAGGKRRGRPPKWLVRTRDWSDAAEPDFQVRSHSKRK